MKLRSCTPGKWAGLLPVVMLLATTAWPGWAAGRDTVRPSADLLPSTTVLTVTPSQSYCGDNVTLRAAVSPNDASGRVEFFDGPTSLGQRNLDPTAVAQLVIAGLPVGVHSFTAVYQGDGYYLGSNSDKVSHEILIVPTSLTLQAPAQSFCGDNVTLRVSVSPSDATGTVQFFEGMTSLGTRTLDPSGNAQLTATGLATGSHTFRATYGGDPCHGSAESNSIKHQVDPLESATGLAAASESSCDQDVTLQATITPAGATGNVEFFDGATMLASRAVTPSGVVSVPIAGLAVGFHSFSANYSGDGCYRPSGSGPRGHEVHPVATTITLEAPPNSICGDNVNLRAVLSSAAATGTVEFFDGATSLAIRTLNGTGVVVASVPGLAPGMHSITVQYHGDPCYLPSGSSKVAHEVFPIVSTSQLQVSSAHSICGDAITFTATITAGAGGFVDFLDGATSLARRPVPGNGVVVFTIAGLPPGHHSVVASYEGDFCYLPSQSNKVVHDVEALPSSIAIDVQPAQTQCGGKVALTAQVSPALSEGTVRFYDGSDPISPDLPIDDGVAEWSISTLAPGSHSITARFSGGGCYAGSVSGPVAHEVVRRASAVTLVSDAGPVKEGTKVTLTGTLSPLSAVPGTLQFLDGATSLGTRATGPDGVATLSVSNFSVGQHSLTATYGGDSCHEPSVSPVLVLDVFADEPPVAHVVRPNGGEVLLVAMEDTLRWTATDDNEVTMVDLLVSRNSGATFDPIATGIPNSGSYVWLVNGPTNTGPVPVFSALFKVVAHDAAAHVGSDVSDVRFAIYDIATATLLSRFRADPAPEGIEVRWQVSVAGALSDIQLERAETEGGAWRRLGPEFRQDAGSTVALDRDVVPEQTYSYRLVAKGPVGERVTFGPLVARARIADAKLALGPISPNPSGGPVSIDFVVPRPEPVRLSVMDLQGREVAVLATGRHAAGRHHALWNTGSRRGAGLYFVRIQADGRSLVEKLILTR